MSDLEEKTENRKRKAETNALRCTFFLLSVLFFLLFSSPVFSQSKPDFLAVDSAFVNQQYEKAELLALRIIQGHRDLSNDELARLDLTMGYCAIMLGHEDDARSYFFRALEAVPDLQLDPVQVSPKFRVIFDEVRSGRTAAPAQDDTRLSQGKPLRIARLTNLIIPGSGQWQQGHRTRGAIVFGLQAATVGALIWQWGRLNDSREAYLAQTDRSLVAHDYDRYNRDYQMTWVTGIATGLVYFAAQADLIWLKPSAAPIQVAVVPALSGAGIALRW